MKVQWPADMRLELSFGLVRDSGTGLGGKLVINPFFRGRGKPQPSAPIPHVEQILLRSAIRVSSTAAILPPSRFALVVPNFPSCVFYRSLCLGAPPPQGYYPQQPQQAFQGYSGQPGFQQPPQPQTVYVYVLPRSASGFKNPYDALCHLASNLHPRRTTIYVQRV